MNKWRLKKIIYRTAVFAFTGVMAMSLLLTGCGGSADDGGSADAASDDVQTVLIGVPGDFDKISFLDENGEVDGFEIDVFKAIDEQLPQYEFQFEPSTFDNILIELDSGKIDIGSSEYEWSEERAEKYEFANEGFRNYDSYLISIKGSGYTTLDSLAGKTLGNWGSTDNVALQIDKYNEENPDKAINQEDISELDTTTKINALKEGRWDALYDSLGYIKEYQDEFGDIFDIGDVIYESEAYFLYPKDGAHDQLRDDIDAVLKQLKEDGTINEFSQKWIGIDAYDTI